MTGFQCSTSQSGNIIVVAATGDVDMATADTLWRQIHTHLAPAAKVMLDCTGITFIDSMGIETLVRAYRYATTQQSSFALLGASTSVSRLLEMTGLATLIPQFADIQAARSA